MKPNLCPHVFDRFTIRGYCKECDPDLHARREAEQEMWYRIFDLYKLVERRDPLEDWPAFESWVETNLHKHC